MELLLLVRKLAVIVAGIALRDAFWTLVACLLSYAVLWKLLVRWKPYATQGSHFNARLVQAVILLLLVWRASRCGCRDMLYHVGVGFKLLSLLRVFQLAMVARLSGNIPVGLLVVLEGAWCALYFLTLAFLANACVVSRSACSPLLCAHHASVLCTIVFPSAGVSCDAEHTRADPGLHADERKGSIDAVESPPNRQIPAASG